MPADRHLSNVGESGVTQNTTSVYDLSGTAVDATYQTFGDSPAADAEDIWVRLNSEDSDKYEVGLFTFNTGTPNTLTRVSTVESSNADSAVDFGTESIEAIATVIPGQKVTSSDLADFEEAPNIATGTAEAPLTLGANNQGQLVTGLNADQVDGEEASAFADAGHTHPGGDVTSQVDDADKVDGEHASAFADAGHTHPGGDITSQVGDADTVDGSHASAFAKSAVLQRFTSDGTWSKPSGLKYVFVEAWAGGGGGDGTGGSGAAAGGGGGAYTRKLIPASDLPSSVSVTVGAGGAGQFEFGGENGGDSQFGSFLLVTGGLGGTGKDDGGDGGGVNNPNEDIIDSELSDLITGGVGGDGQAPSPPGSSYVGGGGGAHEASNGGNSIYGGGGGASFGEDGFANSPGVSVHGGDGGLSGSIPAAGEVPAGGGAGGETDGADGGRGEVRVYEIF